MNWKVPFFDLQLGDEEKDAVRAVLDSNWITAGPRIEDFERSFLEKIGADTTANAVAVSSATAALHLSLLAMDIGPGDEVIVPSLTFVASANAIRYVGAKPVFADITSVSNWNMSVVDVENKITPKTRAIMPVHYAGYPCDMTAIMDLAAKWDVQVVEDCSHAPLTTHAGKPVGTFGKSGCFSFFSNKNITTGEGGMVLTLSPDVAKRIRMLRSHGISTSTYQRFKGHASGYDVVDLGFNYRLDEIRAALGIAQLKKLENYNSQRKAKVDLYKIMFAEKLPEITIPFSDHEGDASYHIFPVLIPDGDDRRNAVIKAMAERGIQCSIHYRPVHTFTAYEGFLANVPLTDQIASSIITLPLFPDISEEQMFAVVNALSACLRS